MKDVNKAVRVAIMEAIDGAVTVNAVAVPAYHEENPNESESLYIILTAQAETDDSNKGAFETIGTVSIDIVHLSDGHTYSTVDTVADGIMQILQPSPRTHGLTSPAGLQIWDVQKLGGETFSLTEDNVNVMRRILRYQYKVNQL